MAWPRPGRAFGPNQGHSAQAALDTADTAVRLGRYFENRAQFWLDPQSQYDIALVARDHGEETARRVCPANAV